jgi:pyruvate carboxylase subunit B
MNVEVDGQMYNVKISYPNSSKKTSPEASQANTDAPKPSANGVYKTVTAPLEGKFFLTKDSGEKGIKVGDTISSGDTVGYIEAMKVINAISSDKSGKIVEIIAKHGEDIEEDDIIVKIA